MGGNVDSKALVWRAWPFLTALLLHVGVRTDLSLGGTALAPVARQLSSAPETENAACLYRDLITEVGAGECPELDEICLTNRQLAVFLAATKLNRCEFYPDVFERHSIANFPESAQLPRDWLFLKIARSILQRAEQMKVGNRRSAELLMKAVVRFGAHIREQDDEMVERSTGFAVEITALEALVSFYTEGGMSDKARKTALILRQARKRDQMHREKHWKLSCDKRDLNRLSSIWLKDPEILWRRAALVAMVVSWQKRPEPDAGQHIREILAWAAESDPAPTVRSDARWLLSQIDGPESDDCSSWHPGG